MQERELKQQSLPAYAAEEVDARDDVGALTLTAQAGPPDPSMVFRYYLVNRPTAGDVVVRFIGKPRQVDASTRNGPLYDLRAEADGLLGAGMYFLALPPDDKTYRITLDWDLSHVTAGTRGAWSLGEGRQELVGTTQELFESGFAIGNVKSFPSDGKGVFALYWLSDPPFDMLKLAGDSRAIYRSISRFFGDGDASYRIFARRNPYPASGGSGWTRSFVFAYGSNGADADDQKMLLTHEMVHNWPRLDDNDLSSTAWYTEGTAEYYAAVLSYRTKMISLDKFVQLVNEYVEAYQTNPFNQLSNVEVGEKFWEDARAQRMPYVRGFMYLLRLNAQIQAHSQGKRSVDDLVLEVLARQRAGKKVLVADWRALVVGELGDAAGREYDEMAAGKLMVPPESAPQSCLRLSQRQVRPFDLGFDEMSKTVVRHLRPGSEAEIAGLLEGDRIVSMINLAGAYKAESEKLSLVIERNGKEQHISYLPRRAAAQVWYWSLPTLGADANCNL